MSNKPPKRSNKIKDDEAFARDWKAGMPLLKLAEKHGLKGAGTVNNLRRLNLIPQAVPRPRKKKEEND